MHALFLSLGGFLTSIFGASLSFFVAKWNGRIIFKQAQILLMFGMMAILYNGVTAALGAIYMAMPTWLSVPYSWVAPSNINQLIVVYVGFRIALAVYRWKHTQIKSLYGA
jgi:hypothetical protein